MKRRRLSNLDIIGRWLFWAALPWCLLAPFRFIQLLWLLLVRTTEEETKAPAKNFYSSRAWQNARVKCLELNMRENGGFLRCELCKRTEMTGVKSWHCHHVKSRSNWPELALVIDNLAVCCPDCNYGMSNRYEDLELNRCRRKTA
ncbi:MAG: HNH endonuclease [Geminicoccaceae bacterium]